MKGKGKRKGRGKGRGNWKAKGVFKPIVISFEKIDMLRERLVVREKRKAEAKEEPEEKGKVVRWVEGEREEEKKIR